MGVVQFGNFGAKALTELVQIGNFGAKALTELVQFGNFGAKALTELVQFGNFGAKALTELVQFGNFGDLSPILSYIITHTRATHNRSSPHPVRGDNQKRPIAPHK